MGRDWLAERFEPLRLLAALKSAAAQCAAQGANALAGKIEQAAEPLLAEADHAIAGLSQALAPLQALFPDGAQTEGAVNAIEAQFRRAWPGKLSGLATNDRRARAQAVRDLCEQSVAAAHAAQWQVTAAPPAEVEPIVYQEPAALVRVWLAMGRCMLAWEPLKADVTGQLQQKAQALMALTDRCEELCTQLRQRNLADSGRFWRFMARVNRPRDFALLEEAAVALTECQEWLAPLRAQQAATQADNDALLPWTPAFRDAVPAGSPARAVLEFRKAWAKEVAAKKDILAMLPEATTAAANAGVAPDIPNGAERVQLLKWLTYGSVVCDELRGTRQDAGWSCLHKLGLGLHLATDDVATVLFGAARNHLRETLAGLKTVDPAAGHWARWETDGEKVLDSWAALHGVDATAQRDAQALLLNWLEILYQAMLDPRLAEQQRNEYRLVLGDLYYRLSKLDIGLQPELDVSLIGKAPLQMPHRWVVSAGKATAEPGKVIRVFKFATAGETPSVHVSYGENPPEALRAWLTLPIPPELNTIDPVPLRNWHEEAWHHVDEAAADVEQLHSLIETYKDKVGEWLVTEEGQRWFHELVVTAQNGGRKATEQWLKAVRQQKWCQCYPAIDNLKDGQFRWPNNHFEGLDALTFAFNDEVPTLRATKVQRFAIRRDLARCTVDLGRPLLEVPAVRHAQGIRGLAISEPGLLPAASKLFVATLEHAWGQDDRDHLDNCLAEMLAALATVGTSLRDPPDSARIERLHRMLDNLRNWAVCFLRVIYPRKWCFGRPVLSQEIKDDKNWFTVDYDFGGPDTLGHVLELKQFAIEGGARQDKARLRISVGAEPDGWTKLHEAIEGNETPSIAEQIKPLQQWLSKRLRNEETFRQGAADFVRSLYQPHAKLATKREVSFTRVEEALRVVLTGLGYKLHVILPGNYGKYLAMQRDRSDGRHWLDHDGTNSDQMSLLLLPALEDLRSANRTLILTARVK